MQNKTLQIWIFVFLISLLLPLPAQACRCQRQSPDLSEAVSKSFTGSALIFLGEVQSINPAKPAELPAGLSGSISVERDTTVFNVHKIWKGDARLSDNIALIAQRTDCTYWFKAGSSYLVYAYGPDEDGYYSTNKCSLTTTVENADEQIEILNALISAKAGQSSDDYFGYG
jgi:hypothetical protein